MFLFFADTAPVSHRTRRRSGVDAPIPPGYLFLRRQRDLRHLAREKERRVHHRQAVPLPDCHGGHGPGPHVHQRRPGIPRVRPVCMDVRGSLRWFTLLLENAGV